MSKVIFSIDPGKQSGVALLKPDGLIHSGTVNVGDSQDLWDTRMQIEKHTPQAVVVEAVAWRASALSKCPKYHSGVLIGALGLQNLPLSFVNPSTWRKVVLGNARATKDDAMKFVKETYGFMPVDDNQAEAVCIAHWYQYIREGVKEMVEKR